MSPPIPRANQLILKSIDLAAHAALCVAFRRDCHISGFLGLRPGRDKVHLMERSIPARAVVG